MALASVQQLKRRKLDNWIDGFLEYTERLPSPPLFRKWAAISAIAGALERKVWVRTLGSNLYPNMYIVLVAKAGTGKTVMSSQVYDLWSKLDYLHIASSSVTRASLIDDLRDAERRLIFPDRVPSMITFNSLQIASNELGVLLPSYENDFMSVLTDLWDGHPYSERRRTKELHFKIEHPTLNLIASTTPSYLNSIMPEGAWEQGFISRVMLIYSGEIVLPELFSEDTVYKSKQEVLVHDLKLIGELFGQLKFSPEAAHAITDWYKRKGAPQPEHPRLANYAVRRIAHLLKLCIITSVARSDQLEITLADYQLALDLLTEAEVFMPDIFKSMTVGGDARAVEETWYHVYLLYMKEKKPIAEHRIIHFLQERVPTHNVARVLDLMVRGKILQAKYEPKVGKCYVPKPRQPGG